MRHSFFFTFAVYCVIFKKTECKQKRPAENDFPKGKQFYHYPKEMDEANLILQKPLPVIHRCKSYGRWMVDVEKFIDDLSDY